MLVFKLWSLLVWSRVSPPQYLLAFGAWSYFLGGGTVLCTSMLLSNTPSLYPPDASNILPSLSPGMTIKNVSGCHQISLGK